LVLCALARQREAEARQVCDPQWLPRPTLPLVLLTDLRPGQRAAVLQLPAVAQMGREDRLMHSRAMIIDAEPIRTHELDPT
jgi:hypothetical protein